MITLFKNSFNGVLDEVLDTYSVYNTPKVFVHKNESDYKILMGVPGLTKEDIKISTKDGILTISYKKEERNNETQFINTFYKTYTLPEDVIVDKIKGKVENGILELLLPTEKVKTSERVISLN